jgi:hypothetical protein
VYLDDERRHEPIARVLNYVKVVISPDLEGGVIIVCRLEVPAHELAHYFELAELAASPADNLLVASRNLETLH